MRTALFHPAAPRRPGSRPVRRPAWARAAFAAVAAAAALLAATSAAAQDAGALQQQYQTLAPAMARSPFQRPIVLDATPSASRPTGDVYAVVDHPFSRVAQALQGGHRWCDMLILQMNVKRCVPRQRAGRDTLDVAIGRKAEQPADDAHPMRFRLSVPAARPDYLAVQMASPEGPLGTRDYLLRLQAVPLDNGRTFLHMSYAYSTNLAARLATDAYLATAGRNKVGFTVVGHSPDGRPEYVRGVQGIAERNTMRYFLAIDAYLDSLATPPAQQADRRLNDWFDATERYPAQLREMDKAEYLAMKRREIALQVAAARGDDGSL